MSLFPVARPIIGMLHLPALPGSPGGREWSRTQLQDFVLRDAQTLSDNGVDALMLENFGDVPFAPDRVAIETVAAMTWLATEVRSRVDLPLGINVLRNDGRSALAIAAAVGATFIRVNILCGVRVTDQGLLSGIAYDLIRDRNRLGADVAILADLDVKHSAPLVARPLAEEVAEHLDRGGADGLIVTGVATGSAADPRLLREVKRLAGEWPVYVGSGVSAANIAEFLEDADGFIVGTALKQEGRVGTPVDPHRVRDLVSAREQPASAATRKFGF
jgi:membrane complex biogenesis BtpA family protein